MRFTALLAATLTAFTSSLSHAASTEAPSRWEAGVALGAYSYNDWRGAEHRNTTFLPLPYLIYRGSRVSLARSGLKIRLLDSERASLNIAAAFALAGDAANNSARQGMDKLLGTFQAGPVLNVNINPSEQDLIRWDLRLPVYFVAATNFKRFHDAGVTAFPHLRGRYETQVDNWKYRLGGSVGVELASEKNNDYFYQVRPSEARPGRPAYDAKGGYGGTALSSYGSAARGPWGYGIYARYDLLQGATFEESPLVQQKHSWSAGLGLSYRFYKSTTLARSDDNE